MVGMRNLTIPRIKSESKYWLVRTTFGEKYTNISQVIMSRLAGMKLTLFL